MYMYSLNSRRSFSFFAFASRRASLCHPSTVRSAILYGAYLPVFLLPPPAMSVAFRRDLGRCRKGIGYENAGARELVSESGLGMTELELGMRPAGGCSIAGLNVRYSSFHFGGCFAVPFRLGR